MAHSRGERLTDRMKRLIYLLVCLSTVLHAEIIWQADFDRTGDLDWKRIRKNPADSFRTGNGILEAVCSNLGKRPNTGSLYEKDLPDIERGALFFEVLPNATKTGPGNYDNLSLLIRFHGRLVSIRPGWWTFFHPKSGHRRLAEIQPGQWLCFKIEFRYSPLSVRSTNLAAGVKGWPHRSPMYEARALRIMVLSP